MSRNGAQELVMQALKSSLEAALTRRYVRRGLVDPGSEKLEHLKAGVICLVAGGGGNFANWQGREGELGTMSVKLVGFLAVDESKPKEAIEQAELDLLDDVLAWCRQPHAEVISSVLPQDWRQSQQLEHPFGWLALDLKVGGV